MRKLDLVWLDFVIPSIDDDHPICSFACKMVGNVKRRRMKRRCVSESLFLLYYTSTIMVILLLRKK